MTFHVGQKVVCVDDGPKLSPTQIYWQAVKEARMIARRNQQAWLAGEREDTGEATMDLERRFLIAAIKAVGDRENDATGTKAT